MSLIAMSRFPGRRGPLDTSRLIPIVGYFDRISGRPGDRLGLKVSCADPGAYRATMVRILCADPNPAGPGMRIEPVAGALSGTFDGRRQEIDIGSSAVIPDVTLDDSARITASVKVQPWLLRTEPSVIAASGEEASHGWRIEASGEAVAFRIGTDGPSVTLPVRLRRKHWYQIWCGWDVGRDQIALGVRGLRGPDRPADVAADGFRTAPLGGNRPEFAGPLRLAATVRDGRSCGHFNGRLEDPMVFEAWWGEEPCSGDGPAAGGTLVAWWDFSKGMDGQAIFDMGPGARHGRLLNCPTRAVRGSRWRGAVMKWTEAPRDYAAIHFHEDDLYDCGWDTDIDVEIPFGAQSGVYAIRLEKDGHADTVPFYVLPGRDGPRSAVCLIASTFTHQCYANMARRNYDEAMRARIEAWGAYPWNPDNFDAYGFSTYNLHPDGSGICFSSRLRPVMTARPGYLTFVDAKGSGVRHFPADSHLLYWLHLKNIAVDIVTDEDLDDEGPALLDGYRVVLTGSHPEYHTSGTLDAIEAHVGRGGNFCYLGGNGFYWRVERSPTLPGMLELRRADSGVRAWATAPGENYHQLRPTHGGLWRRNGRAPQQIAGLGFSAQGPFEGSYYVIKADARDSEAGWILDGVTEERLGDYGLNGGGAAGFELDRVDSELGTPEDVIVLASSTGHSDAFKPTNEDMLSLAGKRTETGEDLVSIIRSDIIYYRTPAGAGVFSVGSILFCASLLYNGGDNGISRMLENVLRRFSGSGKEEAIP